MFLPYGEDFLELPDLWDGRALRVEPGPFDAEGGREAVEKALEEPVGSPALHDLVRPGEKIACVIPDLTRRAGVDTYLPLLLSRLISSGIRAEDVTVVVALGIHRPLDEKEIEKLVGDRVLDRFKVVNHDPDSIEENLPLGVTDGGVPVQINRNVAAADRVILTGGISYHYFTGYGGGRKVLLPGVASRLSCQSHHRMVVSWRRKELGGTLAPGVLKDNPVHREMLQACSFVGPIFLLSTITDPRGRIIDAFSGDLRQSHAEACRAHDRFYRKEIPAPSSLVIGSAGGFPKDVNMVQAHKCLYGAHMSVIPGGAVVLFAKCSEGAGYHDFFSWFSLCRTEEDWLRELDRQYHINGQTAFSTWLRARTTPTILVSSLDREDVRSTGMIPASGVDEAISLARGLLGDLPVPIILPDAGETLTVIRSPKSNVQR